MVLGGGVLTLCPFKSVFMSPEPESSGGGGRRAGSAWQGPTHCFAMQVLSPLPGTPPQVSPTCPGAGSCEDPQCLCAPALALLSPVHPQLSRLHGTESHGGGQVGLPGSPVSEPAPSCLGAGALPTFLDLLFLDLLRAHLVGFRLLVGAQLLHVLLLLPLGLIQVPLVGAEEGLSQPRGRGGRPPRPTPHLPTAPSLEVNPAPRPAVRGTFLPQTLAFKSLSQLSEGRLPSPGWAGLPHPFCLVKSHLEGANWWCVLFPIFLQL